MSEKLAYTIQEATKAIGLGRSKIYELIKSGHLIVAKIGKRTIIPAESLSSLISSNMAAGERNE